MNKVDLIGSLPRNFKAKPWGTKRKIQRLVIHHSATDNQTVYDFNAYHMKYKGWYSISYIYVIDKDGTVNKCNYEDDYTYHAVGTNYNSIGICLAGNYDDKEPPEEQKQALVELIAELTLKYQIGPDGVVPHRDFKKDPTKYTCPGKKINMVELRETVRQWLIDTSNYG